MSFPISPDARHPQVCRTKRVRQSVSESHEHLSQHPAAGQGGDRGATLR